MLEQASAYNLLLHVDYLILSNGMEHYCCKMDYANRQYVFLNRIPRYDEITG